MKQIIVATNDRDKYQPEFDKRGFMVFWCEFSIQSIMAMRGRSNMIFICVGDEDYETVKYLGLYLRDLCIEDDKVIYLYGPKANVDLLSSVIPKLFVKRAMYSHVHFGVMLSDFLMKDISDEGNKTTLLIIADDEAYVERLRPYLDPFFQVYVSRFDLDEMGKLLMRCNVVLIDMDGKLTMGGFMELIKVLAARKRSPYFHFYYLVSTNRERDKMNMGSVEDSISFSKEMDCTRIASYLKNRFAGELVRPD